MKKRKILSVILAAITIFTMMPMTVVADTNADFEYKILEDGTAEIINYTGSATELDIPSEIFDYTVTVIGDYAFSNRENLISVTIPYGVTNIGYLAFAYCYNLESVTIGNSVTSIGKEAFYRCYSLKSITIPGSVTSIDYYAFDGCESLESITVDEKNECYSSDEYGVLFNKDKTELIKYPVGSSRTEYAIPDGVKVIDDSTFLICRNLVNITIPASVTDIETTFNGCLSLASITVDGKNEYYSSDEYGVLFNKEKTELIKYPIGNSRTEYDIPVGVTEIVIYAFADCCNLERVTIPDGVTMIDYYAFGGCDSLTGIVIPDSVTSIGDEAFLVCSSLENVTISGSVTSIGDSVFYGCSSLKSIIIPEGVEGIGTEAFFGCESLENITIPDSVVSIELEAFSGTALYNNSDNWVDGVLYIDNCLIKADSEALPTEYTIVDGTRLIAAEAFLYCESLESVTIPEGVSGIGYMAFYNCGNLKNISIPGSVTNIDYYAFFGTAPYNDPADWVDGVLYIDNCLIEADSDNLPANYPIADGTRLIAAEAFLNCANLESVTIPSGVAAIGSFAFLDCGSLKSITIPESVTKIGDCAVGYEYTKDYYVNQIEGFTIYGKSGSAAEAYAKENGFRFIATDSDIISTDGDIATVKAGQSADTVKAQFENENVKIVDKNGAEITDNALVGTGAKVQVLDDNGDVLSEYTVLVPMDVSGDGKITAADARSALRASAQLDLLEGVYSMAANVDGNDKITAADARKILRASAKLETA